MNKQTVIQWLKYAAIAAISLFFLLLILGGLIFGYYASKAPTLSEKDLIATTSSKIYDNQNNLIADLGAEKRINVKTNEIPTDLVNAIVAIEDHRFFNHRGVDFIRIGGAFFSNLRGGRQGGSTLTQQLIKLTYFSTSSSDQTLSRKIQEAWLATQLEQKATKQEILTYYINKVYMSNGNYGMQTAARSYYAKDLKDLSLPQVALLAGMPQAPNQYDPYTNPEAALQRRNLVLKEMLDMKSITNEQYESAVNTPVTDGICIYHFWIIDSDAAQEFLSLLQTNFFKSPDRRNVTGLLESIDHADITIVLSIPVINLRICTREVVRCIRNGYSSGAILFMFNRGSIV